MIGHGICPLLVVLIFSASLLDATAEEPHQEIKTIETDEISVKDFGAVGDGTTDDGPAIHRALETALKGKHRKLTFENKRYFLGPRADCWPYFTIDGATDLLIDGNGAELLITENNSFFEISRSTDIRIQRLTLDYANPISFQGKVVAVNDSNDRFSFDVRIDNGYPPPPHDIDKVSGGGGLHGFVFMPDQYHAQTACGGHFKAETILDRGNGIYRFHPKSVYRKISNIRPGDRITYGNHTNNLAPAFQDPKRRRLGGYNAVTVAYSSDIFFEDVTLHGALSMGFGLIYNDGVVSFRRVNIKCRPDSGRLLAVQSSPLDVRCNRVGPIIEDCIIESGNDDLIGLINTAETEVIETLPRQKSGQMGFRVKSPKTLGAVAGDTLSFRHHPDTPHVDVSHSRHFDMEETVLLGKAVIRSISGNLVTVDKLPPGLKEGARALNLGRSHEGLTIRNTEFKPLMRQAMQLRTLSSALIESNLVEAIGGDAALAVGTPNGRDIQIRNNTFRNLRLWGIRIGSTYYQKSEGSLLLSNNSISMQKGDGIYLHRQIDNVKLLNTRVKMLGREPDGHALLISKAYRVMIQGLHINDPRMGIKAGILIRDMPCDLVSTENIQAELPDKVPIRRCEGTQ